MKLFKFFFGQFFLFSTAFAVNLTYQHKAIDSLCIYEANSTQGTADLTKCGIHAEKGRKKEKGDIHLLGANYKGYAYSWKIDQGNPIKGFSYYKPITTVDNKAVIQTLNNGGGSGTFSTISLLERKGNIIKVTPLKEGDRCNGGIESIKVTSNQLIYKTHLTTYDFFRFAKEKSAPPPNDIESCAVCCKGTAVFRRHLGQKLGEEQFLYIDIGQTPTSLKKEAEGNAHQACFDKLLRKYQQQGKSKLQSAELTSFIKQFSITCRSNKE